MAEINVDAFWEGENFSTPRDRVTAYSTPPAGVRTPSRPNLSGENSEFFARDKVISREYSLPLENVIPRTNLIPRGITHEIPPVAIIGGGAVGCLIAVYLARLGFKIHIFESQSSAHFFNQEEDNLMETWSERGRCALRRIGLEDKIFHPNRILPISSKMTHTTSGSFLEAFGEDCDTLWYLSSRRLKRDLMEQACARENVKVFFGHRLDRTDFSVSPLNLEFSILSEEIPRKNNIARENEQVYAKKIKAIFVFGCDGPNSTVRTEMLRQGPVTFQRSHVGLGEKEGLVSGMGCFCCCEFCGSKSQQLLSPTSLCPYQMHVFRSQVGPDPYTATLTLAPQRTFSQDAGNTGEITAGKNGEKTAEKKGKNGEKNGKNGDKNGKNGHKNGKNGDKNGKNAEKNAEQIGKNGETNGKNGEQNPNYAEKNASNAQNKWVGQKMREKIWNILPSRKQQSILILKPIAQGKFKCSLIASDQNFKYQNKNVPDDGLSYFAAHFPHFLRLIHEEGGKFFFLKNAKPLYETQTFPYHLSSGSCLLGTAGGEGIRVVCKCGVEECHIFDEVLVKAAAALGLPLTPATLSSPQILLLLSHAAALFTQIRAPDKIAHMTLSREASKQMRNSEGTLVWRMRNLFEKKLHVLLGGMWMPLIPMMAGTSMPYAEVLRHNRRKMRIMKATFWLSLFFGSLAVCSAARSFIPPYISS